MGWIPTKRHFAFDITFSRAFFERENRETPPSPVDRAPPALLRAGRQRTGQAPPSDRGNKEDRLWPLPCRGGHYFLCRKAESQQENRRFARLTLAFSKKRETLKDQLTLYRDLYNCCHPHRGLRQRGPQPVQGKTYRKWHSSPRQWLEESRTMSGPCESHRSVKHLSTSKRALPQLIQKLELPVDTDLMKY